jgi:hypothetical protein
MRLYGSYIKIPIKILTHKIPGKSDSIFYAGKNIAEVKVRDRTYVLTTAGEYKFSYEDRRGTIHQGTEKSTVIKSWKNPDKHTYIVDNWGWFGINVWETRPNIPGLPAGQDQCLDYPTDAYGDYNEAMKAFIDFVEKDLIQ